MLRTFDPRMFSLAHMVLYILSSRSVETFNKALKTSLGPYFYKYLGSNFNLLLLLPLHLFLLFFTLLNNFLYTYILKLTFPIRALLFLLGKRLTILFVNCYMFELTGNPKHKRYLFISLNLTSLLFFHNLDNDYLL